MKHLRRGFFAIFKMPENMMIFVSGILLSTAINIATTKIGDAGVEWTYGWQVTTSTILMFVSSCCFTIMAVYLKPLQEKHKKEHPTAIRLENKDVWFEDLKNTKGAIAVLSILFVLTYAALLISGILLFGEGLWESTSLPQVQEILSMS